jgi:hypothetical protein
VDIADGTSLNGVGGEVYRTDVVAVDQRALEERAMEL